MSGGRRIIRLDESVVTVAREARFESESRLHDAVAAHPEVLPNEDFGLGPLVPLAKELDLGAGPMDLLATDGLGRLVIVEFKRGTENPDVRHVVAQILDYGASLWRYDYDKLYEQCRHLPPGFSGSLENHVAGRLEALEELEELFDSGGFRAGVEACLDSGAFVFVYCGRDLDDRTRRIMTYLAEGPRMAFFAVEVDYYLDGVGNNAVLVPRTAFVPTWVNTPTTIRPQPKFEDAPPEFAVLVEHMNEVARDMGLQASRRARGWNYLPQVFENDVRYANAGIGVYWTSRGVEFNLQALRDRHHDALADDLLARLEKLADTPMHGRDWPSLPCKTLVQDWAKTRTDIIEPYFLARAQNGDAT
jgi:hypothetical protein